MDEQQIADYLATGGMIRRYGSSRKRYGRVELESLLHGDDLPIHYRKEVRSGQYLPVYYDNGTPEIES